MKQTVVQIGAGAIGRGFLGQLWCEGGYETVFVDVNAPLVAELNRRGSYPLRLLHGDAEETRRIGPVRAVLATDRRAVHAELVGCSFAATAVGARHVEEVARTLIAPVTERRAQPLNVLLCENGLSVRDKFLTGLGDTNANIHPVETVVGRMVPENDAWGTDPLVITAEAFHELPFNRSQWGGEVPIVSGLHPVPSAQFFPYELRKLYLHNGGHALLAYHGYLRGHDTIRECAMDETLVTELSGFWSEVCAAFRASVYKDAPVFSPGALESFTVDLFRRFRDPHLGDAVVRVARDPLRKLAPGERLVGAARFCEQQYVHPRCALRAIAAALRFDAPDDPSASVLLQSLTENGVAVTLNRFAGIESDSPLSILIEKEFRDSSRS